MIYSICQSPLNCLWHGRRFFRIVEKTQHKKKRLAASIRFHNFITETVTDNHYHYYSVFAWESQGEMSPYVVFTSSWDTQYKW